MKKCCICKTKLMGYGNNPYGLLDNNFNLIKWKDTDRCCDYCNYHKVLRDRIISLNLKKVD